jgi:eukaryotic-like serine/threonine-protein kinase
MYRNQGKYELAEPLFKEVIAAQTATLGAEHRHTLLSRFNLGVLYYRTGRYEESVPLFEDLLGARRKKGGDEDPETVFVAFNLAANYREAGRLKDALKLIDEWLPRGRTRLGLGHSKTQYGVEVARSVYGRAATPTGRDVPPARAVAFFKELLQAQTVELGEDDLDTLLTKGDLAALYWRMKQFATSVPLFEQELRARRKKSGDEDTQTVTAAFNLAVNYCDAGRVRAAARVIDEWLPRARARLDFDDPTMKFGVQAALFTYDRAGTPAKAELLRRDLAEFWKRKAGRDSSQYATQLGLLGLHLLSQKKAADAEPVLRECLAIRRKKEPDRWTTFSIQSMLGEALLGEKKYAEAEPQLVEGYEGLKQRQARIPKEGAFVLTNAMERLVRLYDAWGKKGQATQWQKKLEAYNEALKKPARPKEK